MKKLLLLPLLFSLLSPLYAAQPQPINFTDLQGQVEPYQDPFISLTEDQLYNLSIYARINKMQKVVPDKVTPAMTAEAKQAQTILIKQQIDIEYLLQQRQHIIEKRKAAAMAANPRLDNQEVEIAGYVLPLEYDNGLVTEFLLVPTVGACSHKPVPPANQMIMVTAKQAVKIGSTYMPVSVSGKLHITPQQKNLFLVDGRKDIDLSYRLENAMVTPYRVNR